MKVIFVEKITEMNTVLHFIFLVIMTIFLKNVQEDIDPDNINITKILMNFIL